MDEYLRELQRLRDENARLKAVLAIHGISLETADSIRPAVPEMAKPPRQMLSLEQKVALFRSLFRGREDVFARRWSNPSKGISGYQPVCVRERDPRFCDKKKYKCSKCPNRETKPLGYEDIYRHLEGKNPKGEDVVGVYAILPDNTCYFLCCDFDDKNSEHGYQDEVRAYIDVCEDWGIPAYVERSRSGNGAHVWILFREAIKAKTARQMGYAILTEAMNREGKMSFKSYDRFFPNQDFMPEGGFGNLVALPLQGMARRKGNSVFVDRDFNPHADQWDYLGRMYKMSCAEVEAVLAKHAAREPLGLLSKSTESAPWERPVPQPLHQSELPRSIRLVRSSGLYIPLASLSAKAVNHLRRIAAFKNPEFYRNLGMHLPTYNMPRIISCSDLLDQYLVMPRGCEDAVLEFFGQANVETIIEDKTNAGEAIEARFNGTLRPEQATSIAALKAHRCGTLYAATAFGKTVTAAALIAERKVNTLILVHTKALLGQWRQRLEEFLVTDFQPEEALQGRGRRKKFRQFGALSSSENTLNGKIDIALFQSCIGDKEVKPFVRDYGMVIVDECHHAPAANFERVLKEVNARYVYGLTATPIRKDGHQPIIFMQCGEIRYASATKNTASFQRLLIPRFTAHRSLNADSGNYAQVIGELMEDTLRNNTILEDIKTVLAEGRSPIALTARTAHVDILYELCKTVCPNVIRLVGKDSAKVKREVMAQLAAVPPAEPLVVVATGKYVGEGFDLPRLDTLMLALPVSWKVTIAQYAGRLHRDYPGKTEVRIYDYIDLRVPLCESMYRKRLGVYKSNGYTVGTTDQGLFATPTSESIFDADTFEEPFHADLASARRSIVISTARLRWQRTPRIAKLLGNAILRGVAVTIVISEAGHRQAEMEAMGCDIVHRPENKMLAAVIDQNIGWYGSLNLVGRPLPDTSALRIPTPDFASTLLSALLP